MARFKIVITDPDLAHQKEIERNVNARLRDVKASNAVEMARATNRLHRETSRQIQRKQAGEVHDVAESDCPEGLPNCRNCGDPHHVATCRAAGHCPDCGTKHGIAPDRIVAQNGYALIAFSVEDEANERAAKEQADREGREAAEAAALDRAIDKAVAAGRMNQADANKLRGHA